MRFEIVNIGCECHNNNVVEEYCIMCISEHFKVKESLVEKIYKKKAERLKSRERRPDVDSLDGR